MGSLGWKEATVKVFENAGEPLHYTEIAEAIAEQQLRNEFGATPASSVNAAISMSLQNDGDSSPFVRVSRGFYSLRETQSPAEAVGAQPERTRSADETGLINAFGMFWSRDKVLWATKPRLLGKQQSGSTPVDFSGQRGVYLLYDGRDVVYVGRTTDQPLGVRLNQHIGDRLNGRWDRFSWFGVCRVGDDGALSTQAAETYSLESLIVTMEALLIEGLEPPQNRKRGDDFRAVEFLQVEDPEIQKSQILQLMEELKTKL